MKSRLFSQALVTIVVVAAFFFTSNSNDISAATTLCGRFFRKTGTMGMTFSTDIFITCSDNELILLPYGSLPGEGYYRINDGVIRTLQPPYRLADGTVLGKKIDSWSSYQRINNCQACNSQPPTLPPKPPTLPPPQPAAPLISFAVDRHTINAGECATLRWDVENVRAVYLGAEGKEGHSLQQVCPPATTVYRLRVVTNSGDVYRDVTVTVVEPPPPIPVPVSAPPRLELQVDRRVIRFGECVTLSWTAAYVSNMKLNGVAISTNPGSKGDCPTSTTTYTLNAASQSGDQGQSVKVKVLPAIDLQVDRKTVQLGECVKLTWAVEYVQSMTLNGVTVSANHGSKSECLTSTTTYTLQATSDGGDSSEQVTVKVLPAIRFWAGSPSIDRGSCVALHWVAIGATKTFLNGIELGKQDASGKSTEDSFFGSKSKCPPTTTTYNFKAVNSSGESNLSLTVTVRDVVHAPLPPIASSSKAEESLKEPQCTWWAYKRRKETGHEIPFYVGPPYHWDAKNWAENTELLGLPVDEYPAVGDVVVWPPNREAPLYFQPDPSQTAMTVVSGQWGHVAYVEEVGVYSEIENGKPMTIGYVITVSESYDGCKEIPCMKTIWLTQKQGARFIHDLER